MKLVEMTVNGFLSELGSDSAAPGGGSAAALTGAVAAALCGMVCRLTVGREKYRESWPVIEAARGEAARLGALLARLVEEDSEAWRSVVAARALPKETEAEKDARQSAIQAATVRSAQAPLETLSALCECAHVVELLLQHGNAACMTDAGSAGALLGAAALAASWNVRVNLPSIRDVLLRASMAERAAARLSDARQAAARIEADVDRRLSERGG
jgi:glutamate formiminotransferase/formiminotetrahydrofolate cyclodeaminase